MLLRVVQSFLLILFAISNTVFADSEVKLLVRAKGTGKLIKRAEVRIGEKVFYTDPKAEVMIKVPDEGDGKILITRFGYQNLFLEFSELRGKTEFTGFMFPAPPSDNEVVVRGEKRPDTSKKTLTVEETKRVAPSDDPAQIAQLLPGVQASTFGTDIAVRGSAPDDSRYYIDHFRVFNIFHPIGDISVLPDQLISDVDFYAGGFGAQYGNATGGVLVLRTKNEIPEESKTQFKINLPFYSAVFHERPISENSFAAASLRYSYLQFIIPQLMPKNSGVTVVPYFGDAHTYYLLKHADGGQTKVLAMGAQDGIKAIFNDKESSEESGKSSIDVYRGFATLGVEHLQPLGDRWSYSFSPQLMYDRSDITIIKDRINWNYYEAHLHFELTRQISKKEAFYIGVEPTYGQFYSDFLVPVQNKDPLYDYEDAERKKLRDKFIISDIASWVSIDKQLGDVIITPGLRGYHDGFMKKSSADPRLAARWELTDQQTLKLAYGLYSQSPEPGQSNSTYGNPDLKFERSIHYVLGLESHLSDRWESEVQLYYKRLFDLVVSDPVVNYSNAGSGESRGIELFLRRNLTDRAFGWLSYTYSQTKYRDADSDDWRPSDYDQTHVGILTGSYKLTALWDVGSRLKYHTGNTYTPISDAVYNASLDKYQPRTSKKDRNSARLPNYHQVDVFATKDFLFDTWKMALRFGVQYYSFTKQVYSRNYNYDYSKEEDFSALPPIPFIEVKGEL